MPSEEDWEIASDICQRLSLFYKVTEVFSGTSYPTANLFFPKLMMKFKGLEIFCYEMLRDYNSGRMGKEANRGTCASEDVVAIDDSLVNFDNFVSQKKKGLSILLCNGLQGISLAIPVLTITSESAFSTSGRLLSPHRSKLHPKTVEALMCAQNWLWAGIKSTSSTKEEDMDIQNILDDYDDEDESGVTRVEESGDDA
uniref:HAT C-terminal dimerisation domain-containing protein n=1 Tax=Fagus sylvatica TaxID=28930 RepID=A0A2N9EKL9_FAGSY